MNKNFKQVYINQIYGPLQYELYCCCYQIHVYKMHCKFVNIHMHRPSQFSPFGGACQVDKLGICVSRSVCFSYDWAFSIHPSDSLSHKRQSLHHFTQDSLYIIWTCHFSQKPISLLTFSILFSIGTWTLLSINHKYWLCQRVYRLNLKDIDLYLNS